jgi:hypothetical protein
MLRPMEESYKPKPEIAAGLGGGIIPVGNAALVVVVVVVVATMTIYTPVPESTESACMRGSSMRGLGSLPYNGLRRL